MENKTWEALKGSVGFYVTMAVCLAVIGFGGWYLLTDREPEPPAEPPAQADVSAPVPELTEPEEPAVVETIQNAPLAAEEPSPMPEMELDDTPVVAEAPRLVVSPLKGGVLTAFSVNELVYDVTMEDWRTHDGMDISAKPGTSVLAACAGTVAAVEDDEMMGTTVIVDHGDGFQTTYANLQAQPTVKAGDSVSAGQIIGAVGTTAAAESAQPPHLHFAVSHNGDAVDPDQFLAG